MLCTNVEIGQTHFLFYWKGKTKKYTEYTEINTSSNHKGVVVVFVVAYIFLIPSFVPQVNNI